MINFIFKWYSVIIAFVCMLYSIGLGLMGNTDEAIYSAHWPGTILLFTIAINQITKQWVSYFLELGLFFFQFIYYFLYGI
mgnify:FL=1